MAEASYPFFTFSNCEQPFGSPQKLRRPPLCIEVPLAHLEEASIVSYTDPIVVGDGQHKITLLKGRVCTSDVFGVLNSDLVPGKYEGGLKLWEGSLDLIKVLHTEIEEGRLVLDGKRVLELGCGHGLPGIFTALKGAPIIHFQDFNAEVLKFLTIPNAKSNLFKKSSHYSARFFAGDWSEVHHLLPYGSHYDHHDPDDSNANKYDGYDIILMAETIYSLSSLQNLYDLIKKVRACKGIVYMSGKKHYFGVGGGTRQFINLVEIEGQMKSSLLAEVTDGSSNVREVWKLSVE